MKKLISILLVAAMLLAVLPMAVFAEGNSSEIVLPGDCFHSRLSYTNNGDDHTVSCTDCDYSVTEAHTFVEGVCVCGAVEVVEPEAVYNAGLTVRTTLSVGAEIKVVYTILNKTVTTAISSYDDIYLVVEKENFGAESTRVVFGTGDDRTPFSSTAVSLMATFTGIWAKEMGDNISVTLHAVKDGVDYYGPTTTTTIKDYLYSKLRDSSSIAELKTLCVDMLNYGAAAQSFLEYNQDNLVNAELTAAEAALGTQGLPTATATSVTSGSGTAIRASVSVQNKIVLYLTFTGAKGNYTDLKVKVCDEASGDLICYLPVTNGAVAGMYSATYDNVGARQMRQKMTFTLMDGETVVSKTLTWSVECYTTETVTAASSTELRKDMAYAILTYGDSVAAYMTATGQ